MQNLYLPKMHIWNKIAIIEKMTVLISERMSLKWYGVSKDSCHFPLVILLPD
jgi:hypothetical protein